MSEVRSLLERLAEKQPGPLPTFTAIQILSVILYLGEVGVAGRKKISKALGIGEGAVRNILNRLRAAGLLETVRQGCRLSRGGLRLYRRLSRTLVKLGSLNIRLPWNYPENYCLRVRGKAAMIRRGLEQRDAAIRAGAEAVIILTYVNGSLHMPGVSNLSKEKPGFASEVVEAVKPEDGDVIIIAGGWRLVDARNGALAAAQTLL